MLRAYAVLPFCFTALVFAVHSDSSKNDENIVEDILKRPNFTDAVVQFAKLWKFSNANESVELSHLNMADLRVRLSQLEKHGAESYTVKASRPSVSGGQNRDISNKSPQPHRGSTDTDATIRRKTHAHFNHESEGPSRPDDIPNVVVASRRHKRTIAARNPVGSEAYPDDQPLDTEMPAEGRRENGGSGQNSCPSCIAQEEAKRLRLEAIKRQILTKLRLSSPPNISKFANVESNPAIARLLNQDGMQDDDPGGSGRVMYSVDEDEFYAKPMRVIHLAENLPPPIVRLTNATDNLCTFLFQETVFRSRIQNAKLSVYIRPRARHEHGRRMTVMLVHSVGLSHNDRRLNTTLVKTLNLDLRQSGRWLSFDVKREVVEMVRTARFGVFKVEAYDHDGRPMAVMRPMNDGEKDLVPYLDVRLKDRPHRRRTKRHYGRDCDATSQEERCCRYPFMVDFDEFGWEFIRQPRRFNAFFCSGACEVNNFMHTTAHGHLVEQVVNNPFASAGPCCVPSKLTGRSILYRDDSGTYIYGIIPGMSVERCGCA